MKSVKWIVIMILGISLISGCGMYQKQASTEPPVAAGIPQAPTFGGGTLQAAYPYPLDQTWNATLSALDMLRMPVVGTNKIAGGMISATGTDGTPISIQLTPRGPGATIVNIRVGEGNEAVSRSISSVIGNQLGMPS